ncbi:hypothetical protein BS50DRAFT_187109 [Corynespora cassiicola Philippines]|uniref:Uncharacterized protein n=1 Tax=Corynespora cassiicola Philippines TaxID=1448308 RepID=A0A2T2P6X4_CORCC|nr:hypothetical protein BS50DRAFT_187109 [Corynespora cassiicola Philippines]
MFPFVCLLPYVTAWNKAHPTFTRCWATRGPHRARASLIFHAGTPNTSPEYSLSASGHGPWTSLSSSPRFRCIQFVAGLHFERGTIVRRRMSVSVRH